MHYSLSYSHNFDTILVACRIEEGTWYKKLV